MPKHNKFTRLEGTKLHLAEDPDELQLLDESDSIWVEAWKNATNNLSELTVHIIIR